MYAYKIDQLVVLIHLKMNNYPSDLDRQVELLQVQHIAAHLHLLQIQIHLQQIHHLLEYLCPPQIRPH